LMTFGPGSTYGEDGVGAAGSYYVLTWVGIAVMLAVLVYWVIWENRRLVTWSSANGMAADGMAADTTTMITSTATTQAIDSPSITSSNLRECVCSGGNSIWRLRSAIR